MNEHQPGKEARGGMNPVVILREAIQAVPAMKYALAVLGIVAVAAIVSLWQVKYEVAIFGTVIILVLMVVVLVFAKLTKVAPKYFLGPARLLMWAFVLLTIVTGTSLFTAAAFRQPSALYELIFSKSVTTPADRSQNTNPPQFVTRHVFDTNAIQRTEFSVEPAGLPADKLDEFLTLTRLAYGTANQTNQAFQVDMAIKNTGREPLVLDLNERFFSMEDDKGLSAQLIYFCGPAKGEIFPPGEARSVLVFFRDPGWSGKGVSAHSILIRVQGLLPVVGATWQVPTLATAN